MSIRIRLTVLYTAILTGFFLCFSLFSYYVVRSALLSAVDEELQNTVFQVVGAAEVYRSEDITLLTLPDDMNVFQTATMFMMTLGTDGTVLTQSGNLSGFEGVLDADALAQLHPTYSDVMHFNKPLRVYTYPLIVQNEDQQRLIGHVQVAQLMDSYQEAIERLGTFLLITGGGVFFFFIILGMLTTNSLLRPLGEITAVALQISRANDLGRRLPDSGRRDEIGHLTVALNQTLERLERLFRAQQRLLADVSHELRTPLTTVRGNIDLMRRFGKYDAETVDIIQDELERMTRLVGDLLMLARADGGSIPLKKRLIELDTIIFDVYRQVQPLEEAQGVTVTLPQIQAMRMMGDADRIKQLVLILVDNAIKYTPAGEEVSISLRREGNEAHIGVADTGPGIPQEHLGRIFDRFYRVDKARSREMGGSGLGLSIAKWIAEAHGGRIAVSSVRGNGSTFTIQLPLGHEMAEMVSLIDEDEPTTAVSPNPIGAP